MYLTNPLDRIAINESLLIKETRCTLREAGRITGRSKSIIHFDVTERIKKLNPELAEEVREILDEHISERSIRGVLALKLKRKNMEV